MCARLIRAVGGAATGMRRCGESEAISTLVVFRGKQLRGGRALAPALSGAHTAGGQKHACIREYPFI